MSYLDLPARAHGGTQTRVDRIVVHATVSPCKPGGARANAYWFQRAQAGVSAHYCVDPTEVVQCLPDDVVGFHAPPNHASIGVELCDPQHGPDERWDDEPHRQMLLRAAALVADLCARHDLPVAFVDAAGLLLGQRGITTHAEVSRAWRESTHTDPGDGWPRARFLDLVQSALSPTAPPEEVDVTADELRQIVREEVAAEVGKAVAYLHGEHALILHGTKGDGTEQRAVSLDSIAKAVGVPGTRKETK